MKRTTLIVFAVLFVLAAGILLFARFFGQQFVEPTPIPSAAFVIPIFYTGQVVALTDHSMMIAIETAAHTMEVPSYEYRTFPIADAVPPVTLVVFPDGSDEGTELPAATSDIRIGSRVRVRLSPEESLALFPLGITILTQ